METRNLLEDGALSPDQLTTVYKAFDAAWDTVKSRYESDLVFAELERMRLADAVLFAYRGGTTDLEALKAVALKRMQR